jgi:hypothetical protein
MWHQKATSWPIQRAEDMVWIGSQRQVIKPNRLRRTVGYQGNSISAEMTANGSSLGVTEYQAIATEPLPSDARDISAGFDRTIQKLTGHKVTAKIKIVHGNVLMEWPSIRQSNGTTIQFTDLFDQNYDEYELLCIAARRDVARLARACTEAVSTLTLSPDTD